MKDKTQSAEALGALLKQVGGRKALRTALGVEYYQVNNWIARGQVPSLIAKKIDANPTLRGMGFTKERMRPDITVYQWESMQ